MSEASDLHARETRLGNDGMMAEGEEGQMDMPLPEEYEMNFQDEDVEMER